MGPFLNRWRAFWRRGDPATSAMAAGKVDVAGIANWIVADLRKHGRSTSQDVADRLGIPRDSVSPRLKPLEVAGRVYRAGRLGNKTLWAVTW